MTLRNITALLLALGVGLAVQWLFPERVGEPQTFLLSAAHPQDRFEPPPGIRQAKLLSTGELEAGASQAQAFIQYADFAEFAIAIANAGRYTLTGIASNDTAEPIDFSVNGRVVSSVAFVENTGSLHADFRAQHIASRIPLQAGENRLRLTGQSWWTNAQVARESFLEKRMLALQVQRERVFGPVRFAFGFVLALALAWSSFRVAALAQFGLRVQLAAGAALFGLILVAVPSWLWMRYGDTLVPLGFKNGKLVERLLVLETYLETRNEAKSSHDQPQYSVAILGDSTHYADLNEGEQMIPSIQRGLLGAGQGYELYGLSAGGLYAWDYYMLVNRLIDAKPDLLVVPLNPASFDEWWFGNPGYHFTLLDRYLRWEEAPGVRGLELGGRSLEWMRMLSQKLDWRLSDGRIGWFLRGSKIYYEREEERILDGIATRWFPGTSAVPPAIAAAARERVDMWNRSLGGATVGREMNTMFWLFDRIVRLAESHGIDVLFYTVMELNIRDGGIGKSDPRFYGVMLERLRGPANLHLLDRPGRYEARLFSDRWIHLTPEGIGYVATDLAQEIARIRGQQAADLTLPRPMRYASRSNPEH